MHAMHTCDTFCSFTSCLSSLALGFKSGYFGAAARLYHPPLVREVAEDLFVCFACDYIAVWSLELAWFGMGGGRGGGAGGPVRAVGPRIGLCGQVSSSRPGL